MSRIEKPWGYEDQILVSQVDVGKETGMLGIRKLVIDAHEMTSKAVHQKQADIIYLEKGTATVVIDGKMHELQKGEAKLVRSGQEHQIQNAGQEVAEVLEISFPYRPEDIERIEDPYADSRSDSEELEQE